MRASRLRPARLAVLWAISALVCLVDEAAFPSHALGAVGFAALVGAAPLFAALVAAAALKLRGGALVLASLFCGLAIYLRAVAIVFKLLGSGSTPNGWLLHGVGLVVTALVIWAGYAGRSRVRRLAAIGLVLATAAATAAIADSDELSWQMSRQLDVLLGRPSAATPDVDPMRDIPPDRLWEGQPALLARSVGALRRPSARGPHVYALTVAGQGGSALFSREAKLAAHEIGARYGERSGGAVVLSNASADLLRTPLANLGTFAAAARQIGARIDPARDLTFVYLASHGSRSATLSTSLPDYAAMTPISAQSVARALREAGIRRRVVLVSACYAASWIPALADDDTIVIAAAAPDRTSFGCDDSRRLTVFGQALLDSAAVRRASLADLFAATRRRVAAWERRQGVRASDPQAYVGRNMAAVWTEAPLTSVSPAPYGNSLDRPVVSGAGR